MSQTCPKCLRVIELPGPPILFCCFCGSSMSGQTLPPTTDGTLTLPPSGPSPQVEVPERLGGYRLLRKLGQGGMGAVYEGEDEANGRRVAVKVIDAEASGDALERFRQEGRLASAIDHPRCVFVYAADEDQGRPYIVLELMPGKTLEDLVQERGPLPVGEAVRLTLDLIEGLEQVHRLGVIHRDVKPSNCFLDGDNRLKVGDFGLARSLAPSAKLTRTGAFVGTPLFAAPEQILNQPLDPRADVYAVCATLYYLLTGKAPHDRGDSDYLAVLARVVSDDPPLIRTRRADLTAALEHILARGLSRDREGRWDDLEDLRSALDGLRGGRTSWTFVGLRMVAYAADFILLYPVKLIVLLFPLDGKEVNQINDLPSLGRQLLIMTVSLLYFGLAEWLAGRTVGKWLMGLRVSKLDTVANPGPARVLVRSLLWHSLPVLPTLVLPFYLSPTKQNEAVLLGLGISFGWLAIWAVLLSTMRPRNGFRGLHEIISGTRVVPAAERRVRALFPAIREVPEPLPAGAPQRLGPFHLQGVVHGGGDGDLLLGLDPALGRQVWVWLRPDTAAEVPVERRNLLRASRLRWLGAGRDGDRRWDAFLAPRGGPITRVLAARSPLVWADARPLVESALGEFRRGSDDKTLPAEFSLDQVWLAPDGTVQIVDLPFGPKGEPTTPADLIGQLAELALEGSTQPAGPKPEPPRVPLPGHARRWLERLPYCGGEERRIDRLDDALAEDLDKPVAVTRSLRALHLGLLVVVLWLFGGCCFGLVCFGGLVQPMIMEIAAGEVEYDEARLAGYAAGEVAVLLAPGGPPLTKLGSAFRTQAAAVSMGQFTGARRQALDYITARKAALWQPQRGFLNQASANARAQQSATPRVRFGDPIQRVPAVLDILDMFRRMTWLTWLGVGSMAALLAIVSLSAFAFRGGVRYRLLGVEVVRLDGRPASRLRCACRAFVAWMPACALLAYARYLEDFAWLNWTPGTDMTFTNIVVPAMQVTALLLLSAGLVASFAWPKRAPHDHFAGTSLVPA